MKPTFKTFLVLAGILLCTTVGAQTQIKNSPVDFSLQIKNMHLWRGIEVTPNLTFATDIHLTDKSGRFTAGLWGGAATNGKFKEFDYYLQFSQSGFTLALWDIYNFSPRATYNNEQVFNYKARETGHFIDLSAAYRFQGEFPLRIFWATILHGRDRDVNNSKNLYSTYVELDYPVLHHRIVNLNAGLAGAFALSRGKDELGEKTSRNFYGHKAGIVDIHLNFTKDVVILGHTFPVSALVLWNPVSNYANIQLAINIF